MADLRSHRTSSDSRQHSGSYNCLPLILFIFTIVQLLPITVCQDFEDLNKQTTAGNFQLPQQAFTSSRQPQLQSSSANPNPAASPSLAQQPATSLRQSQAQQSSPTRPILSSRFAPQGLSAQASSSATTFASPQQTSASQAASGSNNVEQLMKNALARTARLEAEARQDRAPEAIPQSRSGQSAAQQAQPASASNNDRDRTAESSETSANGQLSPSEDDDKATTAAQTTTTNGHETVYSDQRFANLFARRNVGKKARLNPTEQVKAKPTLPSFIKSPPDPKQFTATIQERPSSAPITLARAQQSQPKAGPPIGQPKKAITSSSAANANNRRNNALNNNKPSSASATPKAAASNAKATQATTSKPVALNNPFNRQNSNSNDPANVIAMARKRLLANNAIESAKLKQQQKPSK